MEHIDTRFSTVQISFDGVHFKDGTELGRQLSKEELVGMFGSPDRTESPSNTIHFYDDLGIYFLQDHASELVRSMSFLLEPENASFRTAEPFSGELWVFEQFLHPGRTEGELRLGEKTPLKKFLPGVWSAEERGVYICVDTKKHSTKTGGRTKARYVVSVSVSFRYQRTPDTPGLL